MLDSFGHCGARHGGGSRCGLAQLLVPQLLVPRWLVSQCGAIAASVFALGVGLLASAAVHAQDANEYSPLVELQDLARVIGAIHYRQRICSGSEDLTWHGQMVRLLELEAPVDGSRRRRLVAAFNTGYENEEVRRPLCQDGYEAEQRLAAEGRRLAEQLFNRYVQ